MVGSEAAISDPDICSGVRTGSVLCNSRSGFSRGSDPSPVNVHSEPNLFPLKSKLRQDASLQEDRSVRREGPVRLYWASHIFWHQKLISGMTIGLLCKIKILPAQ